MPTKRTATRRVDRDPSFDVSLGARIRAARKRAGKSQGELALAVGVSHQQVHKYEIGMDRVAAGTLQVFADVLGTHPGAFFDDWFPHAGGGPQGGRLARDVGMRVAGLRDPTLVARLSALVVALASRDERRGEAFGSGGASPSDVGSAGTRGPVDERPPTPWGPRPGGPRPQPRSDPATSAPEPRRLAGKEEGRHQTPERVPR